MIWKFILFFFLGYIIGAFVTWFIFNPKNSYKAGFKEAIKTCTNWNKGFEDGVKATLSFLKKYMENKKNGN